VRLRSRWNWLRMVFSGDLFLYLFSEFAISNLRVPISAMFFTAVHTIVGNSYFKKA
jgi:hypothetical protein